MKKQIITILLVMCFCVGIANAANYWVTAPSSCPSSDAALPGQNCGSLDICGEISGVAQCADTSGISIPTSFNSAYQTQITGSGQSAGYILNCFAPTTCVDKWSCQVDSTCQNTKHVKTKCNGVSTAQCYDGVAATPLTCVSGWCNADTNANDCETQVGSACTRQPGNIPGTMALGTDGTTCTCSAEVHTILTRKASDTSTNPALWVEQMGTGPVARLEKSSVPLVEVHDAGTNQGQIYFPQAWNIMNSAGDLILHSGGTGSLWLNPWYGRVLIGTASGPGTLDVGSAGPCCATHYTVSINDGVATEPTLQFHDSGIAEGQIILKSDVDSVNPGAQRGFLFQSSQTGIGMSSKFTQNVYWGSGKGMLVSDQGASIELGGTGQPYIDFSNDASTDYDMRIQLKKDGVLTIDGGSVGIGVNPTDPAFAKLYVFAQGQYGIRGVTTASLNDAAGVYGEGPFSGVYGVTSVGIGVYGKATQSSGYSGYFIGGKGVRVEGNFHTQGKISTSQGFLQHDCYWTGEITHEGTCAAGYYMAGASDNHGGDRNHKLYCCLP